MQPRPFTWLGVLAILFFTLSISGCVGFTSAGAPAKTSSNSAASSTLAASATTLSFTSVAIGSNGTLGVTFTNAGNSNVSVSNVSISGAGFSASGVSTGQILTPGQTATMNVTFTPATSTGVSGSVTVASNAANSPTTVSLTGTGIQPVPHSVTSNWTPSTSSVAGYYVYSSAVSGGPYTRVNSTLVTSTQYVDSTVQSGHAYFYVVTSVDPNDAESIFSNEAPAFIP